MLRMLCKNSDRWHFEIFFLFTLENRIWYFVQILFSGTKIWKMSCLTSAELAKWHITYVFLSLGKFPAVFFFFVFFCFFFQETTFATSCTPSPFRKGSVLKAKKKKKKKRSHVLRGMVTLSGMAAVSELFYTPHSPLPPPPPTTPTHKLCLFRGSILFPHCLSICPFIH